MDIQERVNQEAYYGIVPVRKNEKIYGLWDTILVTGGYAIATWCYVQGGYVSTMLPLKQVLTSTFFGMILAGLFLCLAVIIPTRYGIDLWIYQRAVFGYALVNLVWLLALGSTWGYEAINCKLYSNSIMLMFKSFGVELSDAWGPWIGSTCVLLGWWIAIKGPVMVQKSTRIMVPCLLGVGLIIMILVLTNISWGDLAAIKPIYADSYENMHIPYMTVMEWNIAFIFAWYPVLGVFPRLVKTERQSYWGHLVGYAMIMAWFICIGAMTGLLMTSKVGAASTDPTEWLILLGGPRLGLLSLVFIGFANITTQAAATYSITVATKVVKPDWDYKKVASVWSLFCVVLVFWNGIWTYYPIFLSVVGAICGPAVALLLIDFYVIRKQRFSMNALFQNGGVMSYRYSKGVSIPVAVSFAAGILSYFAAYNPITYMPNSWIFNYTTATGLAMIVSAGLYFLLSRVPAINRYLRRDIEEDKNLQTS